MPLKGLALPIRPGPNGRTVVDESDAHAEKILVIALSDGDNRNAFQQNIALGADHVFAVSSSATEGAIRRRLRAVFAELETALLYRLVEESITFTSIANTGDLLLVFRYINLESDEEKSFQHTIRGSR